ncbi:MAG TPA: hypothetical protein VM327_02965 [Candidatus Thermoplasmatota archaeon]|nr:hypothetical protein [Candidatus Thermoplasmatota archaeon]
MTARTSTHDRLPPAEEAWRRAFCKRNKCRHPGNLTWVCIEAYLATKPGSSGLHDVKFRQPGPAFAAFASGVNKADLHVDDAAELVEPAFHAYVLEAATTVLHHAQQEA